MALVIIYLVLTKCKECRKNKEEFMMNSQPKQAIPTAGIIGIVMGFLQLI